MTGKNADKGKAKRPNRKQAWGDAVEFMIAECVRFQHLFESEAKSGRLRKLPKNDLLYELRGETGRKFVCGRAAYRQLQDAAEDALRRSDLTRTVSTDRLFKTVQKRIVERFIDQGKEISLSTVDSAFSAALNDVRASRADSRHFIPCQLMFVADPDRFSVGPVTFHNRIVFRPIGVELFSEIAPEPTEEGKKSSADHVLEYYGHFSWVAEVTIKGCDQQIGAQRASQAVNAALDFLHLLFGHYHSRKMVVGGPGLDSDIRATLEVREGSTDYSYSVGATSAVGFQKGWAELFNRLGSRQVLAAAGRAIEAITDPAMERPLALRFIDAASWHGQAVRETSAASSIVKSVTALERLVMTEKSNETVRIVSERSAAMSYHAAGDERFDSVLARMRNIYDLRSRLAHGTLSPFDAEVERRRTEVLEAAERALINGLALFDQDQLFDCPLTRRELSKGLDNLVSWAREHDNRRFGAAPANADPSASPHDAAAL